MSNYKNKNGILVSKKGNRATIEYWGTELKAAEILAAMDSSRCYDCSDCSYCSYCSYCSRCSDCSDCSRCYGKKEAMPEIPIIEDIHAKVLAAASAPNGLDMSAWHTCETTHCRAGWVCHLAGEKGKELEAKTSPLFAAIQIYKASGYEISPCRFFDSNEDAIADMKQCAEVGTPM